MFSLPDWSENLSPSNPIVYFDIDIISSNQRVNRIGRIEMCLAADIVPTT